MRTKIEYGDVYIDIEGSLTETLVVLEQIGFGNELEEFNPEGEVIYSSSGQKEPEIEIDWDNIPEEYNWAAMDENGDWYVFESKPVFSDYEPEWAGDFDNSVDELRFYTRPPTYNGDWKDSLQERPR